MSAKPTTSFLYQSYLAQTHILQAAERAGVELMPSVRTGRPASDYFAKNFERVLAGEAAADFFVNVYGAPLDMSIGAAYASGDNIQERREADLLKLVDELPGALVIREGGNAYIFGCYGKIQWIISCGQALCERVQVGTKTVMQVDPEALARVAKELPEIEVEEPVFEWRCNDAELASL